MNKKLLTAAIAGAMTTPMAAQAVKYKLSGQVNRAIVYQDDDDTSGIRNVDSISSGTRFRLRGSEDLGNGMKVGFYWEMQTSSEPSFQARPGPEVGGTIPSQKNGVSDRGQLRQANVWFSGKWGKLTMGQTDGAGNGATEVDLSGTGVVQGHYQTSYSGGMAWRTSGGGFTMTNSSTYAEYDSFSRYDAIRYDSPALGPVTIAASIGNDDLYEIAGRLNTGIGGGKLSMALFYADNTGATANELTRYGGSASYLFHQGTSITGAWGFQDQDVTGGTDSDTFTIKLGHKWGPHAVGANFSISDEAGGQGFEHSVWGVAYVHSLKKANTQLYAMFQFHELDQPAGLPGVGDHMVGVVGARVRFD